MVFLLEKRLQIFQDEGDSAVQTDLWINSLRAENLAGNYSPVKSDYPVRILTRRTLGDNTASILESRGTLPARMSYGASSVVSRRPPC